MSVSLAKQKRTAGEHERRRQKLPHAVHHPGDVIRGSDEQKQTDAVAFRIKPIVFNERPELKRGENAKPNAHLPAAQKLDECGKQEKAVIFL